MDSAGAGSATEWELMWPVGDSSVRALGLSWGPGTEAVEQELDLACGDPVPVAGGLCDERRLGPGQGRERSRSQRRGHVAALGSGCRIVAHAAVTERVPLRKLAGAKRQRGADSGRPRLRPVIRRSGVRETQWDWPRSSGRWSGWSRDVALAGGPGLLVRLNGLAAAFLQPFGKHELHALDECEH